MIRGLLVTLAATAALSGIPSAQFALGQEPGDQRFGTVHFPTSCNETAQRRFDRAMRYQHSFWYRESRGIFEDVLKADAECGIAYWGIALSYLDNPHNPPPAANLPLGLAALQKAKAIGAKTQRERDFIDALLVLYTNHDKVPHANRVQAYLKAIEAVAQRYPDDDEAQLFHGITLNVAASPSDKTYSNQLKGAAVLEKVFQRQPRHPGVAHYLIHLYDTPALAHKGLDAAKRYSEIAPAAPHAQHMPTHIFTRVGYWKESIALNSVSAKVAMADKEPIDQLHAMDYLVYAHLQLAQDAKAREIIDEMKAVPGVNRNLLAGVYALAAAPARYAIERNDWQNAAELDVPSTPLAHVQAITHFARALGAARVGNPELAQRDIAKLSDLQAKLAAAKDAYWSEQVDIQWQIASAFALYAAGQRDEAVEAMNAAANAEDKTEKHPVTPGVTRPARELFGVMLLDLGRVHQALAAFEATIQKEPNRFNAFAGAAKAADLAGDKAKAKDYYQKLATLASNADANRPELVAAREFLAKN
jgi:tetratricopeptide (TPR) repeat protein